MISIESRPASVLVEVMRHRTSSGSNGAGKPKVPNKGSGQAGSPGALAAPENLEMAGIEKFRA